MILEFVGDICAVGTKPFVLRQPIKETKDSILIVNLEQAVESNERANKSTVVADDRRTVELIKEFDIDVICNANNHAHDSNEQGFLKLQHICDNVGVDLVGIGSSLESATKACLLNEDVYLIAVCQHDFPTLRNIKIADGSYGVGSLNLDKIHTLVAEFPNSAKVVLFVHWGVEHVPIPHPEIRNIAKELAKNKKIKMIIGTHPHIVQPKEVINGCQVFYSIGNFMFPNFVIQPPTQIDNQFDSADCQFTTHSYHKVLKPTYKRCTL